MLAVAARVRADIRSELCLLSETGPISIPLICTYPRVVPSLATQKVGSKPLHSLTRQMRVGA